MDLGTVSKNKTLKYCMCHNHFIIYSFSCVYMMSWVHKFDMHFFFYIAITLLDFDKKQVAQC